VAPAPGPFVFDGAVPGDKSISHRAALLSLLAAGESTIEGYAPGADCQATLGAIAALGADVTLLPDGRLRVVGPAQGPSEPSDVIDAENSGTLARLVCGLLAGAGRFAVLTGDASLRSRPMGRVIRPLAALGAHVVGRGGGDRLPLAILPAPMVAGEVLLDVPSAQVKSAVLLAALALDGETAVTEPGPTRDHTERMLRAAGIPVDVAVRAGGRRISLAGPARPRATAWRVPGDLSSAAFLFAAAAVTGGRAWVRGVGMNPGRSAFLDVLRAFGCDVSVEAEEDWGGEPVADVGVGAGRLRATAVGPAGIAAMIDELPLVAVLAAQAEGRTEVRGAAELRHKETDRITAMVDGLGALGVAAGEYADGFWVEGGGRIRGGSVEARGDHRIAMAFAVLAQAASEQVRVVGAEAAATSFPGFWAALGA
jgi:3-phosphoshikimate 1-carboxyvinyltransferase